MYIVHRNVLDKASVADCRGVAAQLRPHGIYEAVEFNMTDYGCANVVTKHRKHLTR